MDNTQQLLQISAKLYQHLTEIPTDEARDIYIEKIHSLLDERGVLIEIMKQNGFQIDISSLISRNLCQMLIKLR